MRPLLVVQTAFLGDVVLTTPLLAALRRAHPHRALHVVATPLGASVLAGHPAVDVLHAYAKRGEERGLQGLLRLVSHLRKERFEIAIAAQRSARTGFLVRGSGAPVRVGFASSPGAWALTERVPWHADRGPIAELAGALEAMGAACGKVGLDVVLLAESEVGEVSEADGGGSSSMPHKQNPAAAVLARACARLVHANASLLTGGEQELDRAAGAWQAEWPALSAALGFAGGAAAAARRSLEGLEVHPDRMAENARDLGDDVSAAEALVDRALARYREQE